MGIKTVILQKGKTEKTVVLRSIAVIEMCRLKSFVTVCGNTPSHILRGLWVRVSKGDVKTNPAL